MQTHALPQAGASAFTLVDLLAVVGMAVLLILLALPAVANGRSASHSATDLGNFRQILSATAMYAAANNDQLPHPTWGSNLTGPDGWAYATANRGRIPGAPAFPGSAASGSGGGDGLWGTNPALSNQISFFKIGQLGPLLRGDQRIMECPLDVVSRNQGVQRDRWFARSMKITSYTWNGTVGGYVTPGGRRNPRPLPDGKTYGLRDFRAQDILMWEKDESEPFNFNDAASNPSNLSEGASQRHGSGLPAYKGVTGTNDPVSVALVGRFGGSAEFIKWTAFSRLQKDGSAAPNEVMCGPGAQP